MGNLGRCCMSHRPKNRMRDYPPDRLFALIKEHFKYDAVRGKLFWRTGEKRGHAVPLRKSPFGYLNIHWLQMDWRVHRIIWMLVNDEPLEYSDEIDHRNRIRDDNRPSNLRKATHQQNQWNAGLRSDNTSGIRGVCKKPNNRWEANITVNGKPQYLGLFKSPQEAAEAYQKKARELRGEYVPNGEAA